MKTYDLFLVTHYWTSIWLYKTATFTDVSEAEVLGTTVSLATAWKEDIVKTSYLITDELVEQVLVSGFLKIFES